MKLILGFIMIFVVGCGASLHKQKSESKVSNSGRTEFNPYDNFMFCGDIDAFSSALENVKSKLGFAWKEVVGSKAVHKCTFRINVDRAGNIISHEAKSCSDLEILSKVLNKATPVPVPASSQKNECLLKSINLLIYELGNKEKES